MQIAEIPEAQSVCCPDGSLAGKITSKYVMHIGFAFASSNYVAWAENSFCSSSKS